MGYGAAFLIIAAAGLAASGGTLFAQRFIAADLRREKSAGVAPGASKPWMKK